MLCINVTPHDHKMCDSPVSHFNLNLSDSLPNCSKTAKRDCSSGSQLDFMQEFQSDNSSLLEVGSSSAETKGMRSCSRRQSTQPYRFQLEEEVQRLRQQLEEEMELHAVLEDVVEKKAVSSSSSLSCLPYHVKELLSSISTLETTVSRLEEDAVSLQFQLSQERNERRLAEYHLKHPTSHSLYGCSPENNERLNTEDSDTFIQDKMVSAQMFQHVVLGNFPNDMPFKGLWDHPNKLSEEMVRCMKNIFISLVDSSAASSKLSAPDNICLPLSPHGNLSNTSLSSASELSTILSGVQSPQVELQCVTDMSAVKHLSDPYRVRGKLSSSDIGNYALTVEVSWMSVGKKQLEYAAGALRRFRSLVEQLAKVNPIHLNNNEKLAFWINLYNALIMHAYLAYGVPRSDLKFFSLMQKAAYTVGGHSFTAAAIEYVILKMKPPAHRPQIALLLALHKLKVPDEQRSFSIDTLEPLVIFGLSCGMYSSPAVRIYKAKNVREELLEAQRDFIRASVGVSSKGKLLVPKMLHCFARGFVDDSNLAVWISHYLPSYQAAFVEQCVSKRRQRFLGSRNCGILPFDSRFRYLFLPNDITP